VSLSSLLDAEVAARDEAKGTEANAPATAERLRNSRRFVVMDVLSRSGYA
jgi:hypothetical protein